MGWERSKATTKALPPEPSFVGWLLAGGVAVFVGVLLFILHASGMVKILSVLNIWWLAFSPVLGWFFLFCLRGWLWGRTVDEHYFLQKEAEYGQQQWENWAGRYLAVLGSSILLPSGVTSDAIAKAEASNAPHLLSLTSHFDAHSVNSGSLFALGIASMQNAIAILPTTLPLKITVVSDAVSAAADSQFRKVWESIYPRRTISGSVCFCERLSFAWVEERLKTPVLDIDLILVLQKHGDGRYSDSLASMLLTSDDVAEKYQLSHSARLLRPMPLDMSHFQADMELFLETQTIAYQTSKVFCDYGQLNISGKREEEKTENGEEGWIHRGISRSDFRASYSLPEHVKVTGASLENGLLAIELHQDIPEEEKPQRIAINNNPAIEHKP